MQALDDEMRAELTGRNAEHLEMAKALVLGMDNYGTVITEQVWADAEVTLLGIHHVPYGAQVVVVHEVNVGGGEVDQLMVVGFYVPHDGQCTVVVNHMDALLTHDNAQDMFPSPPAA